MKPIIYIASPYTKGDVAVNTRFQCEVFDKLMNDEIVYPVAPLWSHFQHIMFPRHYKDWIEYDKALIPRLDACLRLDAYHNNISYGEYHQHDSSGADGEVALFKSLNKPVFYSYEDLYKWVNTSWNK